MRIFALQIFTLMPIVLTVNMLAFLAAKSTLSTMLLKIAIAVLSIGVISSYIESVNSSGIGANFVIFIYFAPTIYILNFTLFVAVFNHIVGNLKSRLKILTAVSLIAFSIFI
ncbi:MAG: hypothetical protein FWC32_14295 [Firmicutes bacterium]|nr:hypothetical protein [Bacillota bacterium]